MPLLKLLVNYNLQQKSTNECKKMAAETPEEREKALQWMSMNQCERLTVEPPEDARGVLLYMYI